MQSPSSACNPKTIFWRPFKAKSLSGNLHGPLMSWNWSLHQSFKSTSDHGSLRRWLLDRKGRNSALNLCTRPAKAFEELICVCQFYWRLDESSFRLEQGKNLAEKCWPKKGGLVARPPLLSLGFNAIYVLVLLFQKGKRKKKPLPVWSTQVDIIATEKNHYLGKQSKRKKKNCFTQTGGTFVSKGGTLV